MLRPASREVEKTTEGTTNWSGLPQSLEKPWRSTLEHISVYMKEEMTGSSWHRFVKDNSRLDPMIAFYDKNSLDLWLRREHWLSSTWSSAKCLDLSHSSGTFKILLSNLAWIHEVVWLLLSGGPKNGLEYGIFSPATSKFSIDYEGFYVPRWWAVHILDFVTITPFVHGYQCTRISGLLL